VLLLASTAWAAPPDTRARVMALLPETTWEGQPLSPLPVTAAQHVAALKADEQHTQSYWVTGIHGNPDATHVVFLIPQFHRSPLLPLLWSSLGNAIAGVQQNIDYTLTRLIGAHGLSCVGTEGSWAPSIPRSEEQAALANAVAEMQAAVAPLGALDEALGKDAQGVVDLLMPYMKRQALTLDGVGSALWRLSPSSVTRFGLEDEKLNQRALKLLARMRTLEEELARLTPDDQAPVEDAMADIWRTEHAAFASDVAGPLEEAFHRLNAARMGALREGVESDAQVVARFVKVARTLTDEVLRVDDVKGYADYYRDVGRPAEPDGKPRPKPTAVQLRRAQQVARKLAPLQAEYEKLAGEKREQAAASKVLSRVKLAASCALVFGANHEEGLLAALKKGAGNDVAVVVVQPFPPDE
jgi:hypothetical protein